MNILKIKKLNNKELNKLNKIIKKELKRREFKIGEKFTHKEYLKLKDSLYDGYCASVRFENVLKYRILKDSQRKAVKKLLKLQLQHDELPDI